MKNSVMKFFHWIRWCGREAGAWLWRLCKSLFVAKGNGCDEELLGDEIFIDASQDQWIHRNIVFQLLLINFWSERGQEKWRCQSCSTRQAKPWNNNNYLRFYNADISLHVSMDYWMPFSSRFQTGGLRLNRNMATNVPLVRAVAAAVSTPMVNMFALLHSTHKLLNMMFVCA